MIGGKNTPTGQFARRISYSWGYGTIFEYTVANVWLSKKSIFNFFKEANEMKKIKFFFALTCIALMATMTPLLSHAGQGTGDGVPVINIFTEGIPVTITGTLEAVNGYSLGFDIDTGTGPETIYGLGPISYWEAQGVPRPEIGELITVSAVEVTFSDGSTKLIAASVEVTVLVDGVETTMSIELRDINTGLPLWRVMTMNRLNSGSGESAGAFGTGSAGIQNQSKLCDGSRQGESSADLGVDRTDTQERSKLRDGSCQKK
jgi:hypothetical protein